MGSGALGTRGHLGAGWSEQRAALRGQARWAAPGAAAGSWRGEDRVAAGGTVSPSLRPPAAAAAAGRRASRAASAASGAAAVPPPPPRRPPGTAAPASLGPWGLGPGGLAGRLSRTRGRPRLPKMAALPCGPSPLCLRPPSGPLIRL